MIIENRLMWSPACDRHRLDDEPRWPLDSLMHAVHTCSASEIFIDPGYKDFLRESPPLKFYDSAKKNRILEREVRPMLRAIFGDSDGDPWEIDDTGILMLIWYDLEEFFVNLTWCSRMRIPFVFDVSRLCEVISLVRDDLVRKKRLDRLFYINDLIAIMSLYRQKDVWCLLPIDSGRGSAIEIWTNLRNLSMYRRLSHETRKLGLRRLREADAHIVRIRELADRAADNRAVSDIVSVAKTGVSLFLGPGASLISDVGSKLGSWIFRKAYVPPIYSLTDIEKSFDELFYPDRPEELKGRG